MEQIIMAKKFILFIVEGENDEKELGAIMATPRIKELLKNYEPRFYKAKMDVSSEKGLSKDNIQKKLNEILMNFRRKGVPFNNIRVSDIQEVVQITDLDGCFIPHECIVRGDDPKFIYTDDAIITSNIDGAYGRNRKKADILLKLKDIKQIGGVPYSIYFVSSNMEHVLFNIRPADKITKRNLADNFAIDCKNNPAILDQTIFNSEVSSQKSYFDSWEDMLYECESLRRHTNVNLFFSSEAKNKK